MPSFHRRFSSVVLPLALLLAVCLPGQGNSLAAESGNALPGEEEIARAQARVREAMRAVPESNLAREQFGQAMPKTERLPQPAAQAPDIESIAQKFQSLKNSRPTAATGQPDLLIFVSFSMPREALVRTVEQAERAGGTLVFRGLKGDSMKRMGEEVRVLIGERNVSVAIHPPAFQQFSVRQVPAVVIANAKAGSVMEDGCSKPETFAKVTGDVTLDFALDYIERKSPVWASVARAYRLRLEGGDAR
jgi:conjugal transfer pilus assembly protein TrbC